MTTIYSQLCGIGIVTAYLIDIFESSINPLTLVLVSSKQRRTDDLTLLPFYRFLLSRLLLALVFRCLQQNYSAGEPPDVSMKCRLSTGWLSIIHISWVLWNFFQKSFPGAVRHWHGHRSNHLLGDLLGHLAHRQLDLWQWKLRWTFVEQHPCRLHSCSFRRLLPVWLWADEVHPPWRAVWATGAGGWTIFLKQV